MTPAVEVLDEVLDLRDEIADALECAPMYRALRDGVEPDLHLVEPRRMGRGVVHVEAWQRGQPAPHFGVCVRAVVVDDQVNLELRRNGSFDAA